ncbi:MAG: HD domain-containing protein [Candidatus Omnitrophota bacterium]|nr:MAG: HD domain-containing protein [Candidatus Omnitrophota bacterium]
MIRISDIIKMGPQGEPHKENKGGKETSLLDKALKKDTGPDIKQLYNDGIDLLNGIFDKVRQTRQLSPSEVEEYVANSIDFKLVTDYLHKLVDRILLGNGKVFDYFYAYRQGNYLHMHSLNTCLLSIKIGIWLNLNKSDLMNIALGGLLHDLGLVSVEDIISLPRKLKHKELQKIRQHPVVSARMLEKVKDITEDVINAVRGHHKRLTDKDFTKELNSERLQKMAQIIGLADVYEAITHPRSYREPKLPHEAVKELVEVESGKFQANIIKSLIGNIGIYPIGSWVRLTDGEIGIVASINKGYPLRPWINLIFEANGNKLTDIKSIDLLTKPHLHIESPVDINKNKQLIDKLK